MQLNMATITLFIGDLNAHPCDEPHFSLQGNVHEHRPSRFTSTIDSYFDEFAEITGEYWTHRTIENDKIVSLRKLDRCLRSLPSA